MDERDMAHEDEMQAERETPNPPDMRADADARAEQNPPAERIALITGSGKGIGRAIAERLAREGYVVVINFKQDSTAAQETLGVVQSASPRSTAIQADVATPEGAQHLIEETHNQFGRIDVLINNAGPFLVKTVYDTTIEDWHNIIEGNLSSAFYCIKAVLPIMRTQNSGHILNLGSLNVENARGAPTTTAYNVAKTGLVVLTKSVARSEARHGIRCNIVNPGFIETYATTDADRRELPSIIPLGTLGKVQDISNMIAYLLSDQATYITGSVLNVHGGLWV